MKEPDENFKWTPLFAYPFCCLCFDKLHGGHKGWDVCGVCRIEEQAACAALDIDPYEGQDYSCECYEEARLRPWQRVIDSYHGE